MKDKNINCQHRVRHKNVKAAGIWGRKMCRGQLLGSSPSPGPGRARCSWVSVQLICLSSISSASPLGWHLPLTAQTQSCSAFHRSCPGHQGELLFGDKHQQHTGIHFHWHWPLLQPLDSSPALSPRSKWDQKGATMSGKMLGHWAAGRPGRGAAGTLKLLTNLN